MGPKALVIGCSGQDGSYLCKHLLDQGEKVVGTSRSNNFSFKNHLSLGINEKFPIKTINLFDLGELKKLLIQENPSHIYNFSAQSSVGYSFSNPIETQKSISLVTINLLEACRQIAYEGNIFFAGSSEVYGNTKIAAKVESPFDPKNPYAIAKVESMSLVKLYREIYNLRAATGVLFPHESPLRNENFIIHKIIAGAVQCSIDKSHKITIGNINIERDWGWAEDYIKGIYKMNHLKRFKDQIICTGESTKLEEFINITFNKLNLNWKEHVNIDKSLFRGKDINKSIGDPSQMFIDSNWKTTIKIDEIIQRLLESKINKYSL